MRDREYHGYSRTTEYHIWAGVESQFVIGGVSRLAPSLMTWGIARKV